MKPAGDAGHVRWRRRIYFVLEAGMSSELGATLVHRGLIGLVIASVAAIVLDTVPDLALRYGPLFIAIEVIAVTAFSVEYALRLWSAPEYGLYAHLSAWAARWSFVKTPAALIDLLSIMPFYLALVVPADADLRVLVMLRLLRFFKLARYSPGMRSLVAVLEAERKALFACAVVLFGLVLVTATAMHFIEHDAQPDKFGSIPAAMWWAIVTLTTVGYGDVVPITLLGRIVAGFTMLLGVIMLALPIGIIANAFADEIHKREFVVNWSMLARVPLFAHLSAAEIAEIMDYLRAQAAAAGDVIVRRGEPAQAMYFISSGAVEVELPNQPVELGEGQFFGERALLHKSPRSATVRALRPTKLLLLDAADLHALMERHPALRQRIEAVDRERAAINAGMQGDLDPAEVQNPDM
jgi:voltage-gated potassium channel